MTRKVYKSAMGKEVDLGSLLLQNEHIRAVGNMNVNARGDKLDSNNRVIDQKNRQSQRQYQRQVTNVSADVPVHSGTRTAKATQPDIEINEAVDLLAEQAPQPAPVTDSIEVAEAPTPVDPEVAAGGLAGAVARSRASKKSS